MLLPVIFVIFTLERAKASDGLVGLDEYDPRLIQAIKDKMIEVWDADRNYNFTGVRNYLFPLVH